MIEMDRRRPLQNPILDPAKLPDDMLLRPNEVASWIGFSRATLSAWRHHGQGPAFIRVHGNPRYYVKDIRAWLREQEQNE